MTSFLATFFIIFIAELGDKSQLLALSLSSKYKPAKVLLGLFLAILGLQVLAVSFGEAVLNYIPISPLKIFVALSFIIFGIICLKKEEDEKESLSLKAKSSIAAVMAIAGAFFLSEFGDKTQLATLSLSIKYESFSSVLMGSVLGLFVADALAVLMGYYLGKKLPQAKIRLFSSFIFILFGIIALLQAIQITV
jgi:Ca2+/H+ antiporter, TMEM165/GDT1 family